MPFPLPKTLTDGTALYAVAGAGDLAVEKLRAVSRRATAKLEELDAAGVSARLQDQVDRQATAWSAELRRLPEEVRGLPTLAQSAWETAWGQANSTYGDLAVRGKDVVDRVRNREASRELAHDMETTRRSAKSARTTARRTSAAAARSTRTRAKATATGARKTAKTATRAASDAADTVG